MTLKRFFSNKNTVTIIGILAICLILILGYRYQIKRQVNPVTGIPVANTTIQPRTKITSDMISYVDVAPVVLQKNVIRKASEVIDKYSNYNTVIPEGSMFYRDTLVDEDKLPNSAFVSLAEGEVPYNFPVTIDTTYGNSIMPESYIDIYMKATNDKGVLMVGKLLENIKVLAVKDNTGKHVFENSEEDRTPAYLIFGLQSELNILLRKASYMSNYSVELFPVPHGTTVTEEGATEVSSQTLKDFINAKTVANDEITKTNTTTDVNTNTNNNTTTNPTANNTTTGRQ